MVKLFVNLLVLAVSSSAFATEATVTVKEHSYVDSRYDYVACRSTWLKNETEVLIRLGNAPTVGTVNDGVTKIRLMPNQTIAGWGFASPATRGSILIVASKSKDSNMFFDEQRGDSKIIGSVSITSLNRFQVDVTYENQTFHLYCRAIAL